jgi:hypothetical protein
MDLKEFCQWVGLIVAAQVSATIITDGIEAIKNKFRNKQTA